MDFHEKLNCFSRYLSEKFYIYNNDLKKSPIDGTHKSDFEPLTFEDIFFSVPKDTYMGAVYHGTGNDNEFVVQFIFQEYSLFRGDYEMELDAGQRIAGILTEIKSLLTGDGITVNYSKYGDYKVYRDNYAQNSKVRTIFTQNYKVTFN